MSRAKLVLAPIPQKAQPYGALAHHNALCRSRRLLGKTIDWRFDKGDRVASGEVGIAGLRCRRRLFRVMADRNDIGCGLPYFRFRQHITPGWHPECAALLTLGNRFEDISRVA